ncbi:hypothetical protein IX336_000229 [Porphyromonas levii]|nr:hypothetical protein [Porphyromonas levii]
MCTFATVKEKNTSPLSKNGEYYKDVAKVKDIVDEWLAEEDEENDQ